MNTHNYEGKTKEAILTKALAELNVSAEDVIVQVIEEKNGLFKGKKTELKIIVKADVIDYIKEFLKEITSLMNLDVQIEIKQREDRVYISMYSNNNQILIGKNGKTIEAFQMLTNQIALKETGVFWNFTLDVGGYKQKKQENIEYLAKKIAREVYKTKIPVKLDNMNSFERRLVHAILSDNNQIETKSEGEEPNRYVVIKPREE